MKKVLFIHHCSTIGGAGISGLNVVKSLDKSEYDIVIYCPSNETPGMADVFEGNGFKVIRAGSSPKVFSHFSGGEQPIWSPRFIKRMFEIIKDSGKIRNLIAENDSDIVVMNSMTLFWIAKIAKENKKETILFFRETYANGFLGLRTFFIKRQMDRYVDKISFISDSEYRKSNKINSYKKTIYNAADGYKYASLIKSECRQKIKLSDHMFYVLFVGGMSQLKGADVAIKAFKHIKESNILLLFIGYTWEGSPKKLSQIKGFVRKLKFLLGFNYDSQCVNEIIRNSLKSRIIFYPIQISIELFIKACDVIIFPMTRPHQARPVFEAGFAKTPVIVTDFPQIRDLCDESSVYLFPNKNDLILAERIMEIYNNRRLAEDRCHINYFNTVQRHDITKFNEQINRFFEYDIKDKSNF